jgi:hypothetical protein
LLDIGEAVVMDMTEHLIYAPSKAASFGHAPRKRDARSAWENALTFLDHHASGRFRADIYAECIGPLGYGGGKMIFPSQQRANEAFGEPVESMDHWCRWRLGLSDIPSAMNLFFQAHEHHRKLVSSFTFHLSFDFRWSDIDDLTIEGSSLGFHVDDYLGIFLQPTFVFPFSWNSSQHREWLRRVLDDSPFRFREQYFKRAMPTKAKNSYRVLKLAKGWLDADQQFHSSRSRFAARSNSGVRAK